MVRQALLVRVQLRADKQVDRLYDLAVVGETAEELVEAARAEFDLPKGKAQLWGYTMSSLDDCQGVEGIKFVVAKAGGDDYGLEAATANAGAMLPLTSNLQAISMFQEHARDLQPLLLRVKEPLEAVLQRRAQEGDAVKLCQYYIKTLTGKTIHMEGHDAMSVGDVMLAIYEQEGIPSDQQRLVCHGKQLEEKRLLVDYGIGHESVMHLVLRLRGGMFHQTSGRADMDSVGTGNQVHVRLGDGREVALDMQAGHTMRDLKHVLRETLATQAEEETAAAAAAAAEEAGAGAGANGRRARASASKGASTGAARARLAQPQQGVPQPQRAGSKRKAAGDADVGAAGASAAKRKGSDGAASARRAPQEAAQLRRSSRLAAAAGGGSA